MECIFCKIIDKKIPANIVYENDEVIAFKDINPSAPTHILFVPKQHIERLDNISPDDTKVVVDIHKAILKFSEEKQLRESGFRVQVNVGKGGGQVVFHLHYHLLSNKNIDT